MIIHTETLTITINNAAVSGLMGQPEPSVIAPLELSVDVQLKRAGKAVRLVSGNGRSSDQYVDSQLASLLHKAREWWMIMQDQKLTAAAISRREGVNDSYVTRIIRLNFLAPDIVEAIADSRQPAMFTAEKMKAGDFPICWTKQRDLFGFSAK